mgnify:CR=1 FL=1
MDHLAEAYKTVRDATTENSEITTAEKIALLEVEPRLARAPAIGQERRVRFGRPARLVGGPAEDHLGQGRRSAV